MQTAPKGTYKGMMDCAGGILKNEGPLAFYKVRICALSRDMAPDLPLCAPFQGTLTPLLGIGVCVSIQFAALEWSKRKFAQHNIQHNYGGPEGSNLSAGQLFASGSFAGVANAAVSGPVEHIRIRKDNPFGSVFTTLITAV